MTNRGGKLSNERAGKRKDRNKKIGARVPRLGYYLIVTDTNETEKNYFAGLRDRIPAELKDHLVIKVEKAKTAELVERALELRRQDSQYRMPWIVFDRDEVKGFDEIIQVAEKHHVGAGWSNPCFEIWLYAYFGEMPVLTESYACCERFAEKFEKITGQKYNKNDKKIYRKMTQYGDEQGAIRLAERYDRQHLEDGKKKPSEMLPDSKVYQLVDEILGKIGRI